MKPRVPRGGPAPPRIENGLEFLGGGELLRTLEVSGGPVPGA